MGRETRLGIGMGAVIAASSVFGNLVRGDRHILSLFPDLVTLVAVTALLFLGLQANRHRVRSGTDQRQSGLRTTVVAAAVAAVLLAAFAMLWLPNAKLLHGCVVLGGAFASIAVVGYFFVRMYAARTA